MLHKAWPKYPPLHHWFKSYGNFAEWVDFAYWWRLELHREGSAPAACAAGLFNELLGWRGWLNQPTNQLGFNDVVMLIRSHISKFCLLMKLIQ